MLCFLQGFFLIWRGGRMTGTSSSDRLARQVSPESRRRLAADRIRHVVDQKLMEHQIAELERRIALEVIARILARH
jgi:hypothetical protein